MDKFITLYHGSDKIIERPTFGFEGFETARAVILDTMQKQLDIQPSESFSRSKEYWIGWALAYYQWYSDRKYIEILNAVSYAALEKMYYTLHEADVSKFADIIDRRIRERYPETKLKRFRTLYGITQSELADSTGVSLRSIQMYEQRKKDINKAGAQTLYKISKVLGCTIEDLLENNTRIKLNLKPEPCISSGFDILKKPAKK